MSTPGEGMKKAGVNLKLYTYNVVSEGGASQLHGDTNIVIPDPRLSAMTYGWCMRNPLADADAELDERKWDCQRVQADVDPATQNVTDEDANCDPER